VASLIPCADISKTRTGTVQGIPIRSCRLLQRGDGYTYQTGDTYQKGEAARPLPA